MPILEGLLNSVTETLSNEDEAKKYYGLFALVLAGLFVLLIIKPNSDLGGLSGFFGLVLALVIAAITSFSIMHFVLEPMVVALREGEILANRALATSKEQAENLAAVVDRLGLQKQVLDQHCVVSESDAEGRFTYVNDAFCKITGYSREEVLGQPHSIINGENHTPEFWEKMYKTVVNGGVWQNEVCNKRKDGSHFWLTQTIAAVTNSDGELTGYIDFGADITELKALQEEVIRKGKLAQLGQLTSTIAHEIRNPMGAVRTGTYLMQKKIEKAGVELDLSKQFKRINNGVTRCDNIITQLLDFSRSRLIDGEEVVMDDWLKEVVGELSDEFTDKVEIECDLGLGDQKAIIGNDQLRRVLVNHISNSTEAMVGKGSDVPENPTANPKIIVSSRLNGADIEISVEDNGPGIASDDLKRIRDPLFSTKSFGVGLGIPAVEKILENHGGGLRIETEVGRGTKMISWFPISPDCSEETRA